VSLFEPVPLRRRLRTWTTAPETTSTSALDTVTENVQVGETANHIDRIERGVSGGAAVRWCLWSCTPLALHRPSS